jgi:hypothetical protein
LPGTYRFFSLTTLLAGGGSIGPGIISRVVAKILRQHLAPRTV